MKILLFAALIVLAGCSESKSGERGHGWKEVRCFDGGRVVYSAEWEQCPKFAGDGYSELENGQIIKAQCRCSAPF